MLFTTFYRRKYGPFANTVYKRLASLISFKHNKSYSIVMNQIRVRLSFSLLWSTIVCLHGTRLSTLCPIELISIDSYVDHGLPVSRVTTVFAFMLILICREEIFPIVFKLEICTGKKLLNITCAFVLCQHVSQQGIRRKVTKKD